MNLYVYDIHLAYLRSKSSISCEKSLKGLKTSKKSLFGDCGNPGETPFRAQIDPAQRERKRVL